jgi:cellulose synthase/poly-beta-1,6-N-acetylglucosamine synthase-like glycosyltransferase
MISFIIYLFKRKERNKIYSGPENDYGIIVTAYKNAANLDNVINSLLKLQHSHYIIYVVADACPDYEDTFHNDRVVILKPPVEFANQVTSHFYAIRNFKRDHNILTIIDSDNLVSPAYLTALDEYFNKGYHAVQGVRKAKNLDTLYACIDAVNEIYYLFYDRKILFAIGSSSMVSGSGMAFTVPLFRECMEHLDTSGAGFDKVLQKRIIERGYRIAFAENAIVYDEKTSKPDQLVKQRARWNNTWFRYFRFGYYIMGQGVKHLSINRFLFGFILTRPPLFLLLMLSFIILIANIFISLTAVIVWIFLFMIFIAGFFLALLQSETDKRIYRSLIHIPKFVLLQFFSLFKAKKANEYSVATEHSYNKEIEKI